MDDKLQQKIIEKRNQVYTEICDFVEKNGYFNRDEIMYFMAAFYMFSSAVDYRTVKFGVPIETIQAVKQNSIKEGESLVYSSTKLTMLKSGDA